MKVGEERWTDIHGWQNITGMYRINKATDNYKVGDLVTHTFYVYKSVFATLLGNYRAKTYTVTAVVREIDTTNAQKILPEIDDIMLNYYHKHVFNSARSHQVSVNPETVEYNYKNIGRGDKIWTKPYNWLVTGQHFFSTGAGQIPYTYRNAILQGCSARFYTYDCDGNEFSLYSSQVE